MPNASIAFPFRTVAGRWRSLDVSGGGTLSLHDEAWELTLAHGPVAREGYAVLSGAEWRADALALHAREGVLVIEAEQGLDRAWVQLTALACPLAEFTRALRYLGSSRVGDAPRQARFFAPLLHARRLLQDELDLERRLAAFNAAALVDRITQVLKSMATEAHRFSPPDRRALEAELLEAAAPLVTRLRELDDAAARFRAAGVAERFDAWRTWTTGVADVFSQADQSWRAAADLLPPRRAERRRWWRRRQVPAVLVSLGTAVLAGWR
jgi:hypothetical protein